jgi:hypothetical protein
MNLENKTELHILFNDKDNREHKIVYQTNAQLINNEVYNILVNIYDKFKHINKYDRNKK